MHSGTQNSSGNVAIKIRARAAAFNPLRKSILLIVEAPKSRTKDGGTLSSRATVIHGPECMSMPRLGKVDKSDPSMRPAKGWQ